MTNRLTYNISFLLLAAGNVAGVMANKQFTFVLFILSFLMFLGYVADGAPKD